MNATEEYIVYEYGDYPDDFWNFFFEEEPHQIFTTDWVAVVMYAIVFLIGVLGNSLVLWVTIFNMKRTVHTVWFINLAIADLLCCALLPVSIMDIISGRMPLGLFACKSILSFLLVNMYAGVLLLTVISIDRCAMVLTPVWCHVHRTLKKAYVACGVIWFLAFLMSTPSFVFHHISVVSEEDNKETALCGYNYALARDHKKQVTNFIGIYRLLLGFVIPFLVITVCYGLLLWRVWRRFNRCSKSLKVALTVIIGFFICCLPYNVAGIIFATNVPTSALFRTTAKINTVCIPLAFVNSCINPVIYGYMGQDYKGKLKRSVSARFKVALEEDMSLPSDKKSRLSADAKNTDDVV